MLGKLAGALQRSLGPARLRLVIRKVASIEAATAAGDIKSGSIASANRFWFGQHVAAMVAFGLLPGRASVPYQGTPAALVEEASRFILRGIGMKEAALTAALAADANRPFQLELA